MTREQAFERLELPIGSDLQTIRRKFAAMHNDYRMQIDNAFNPTSKHIFEQKLEELKEAYALLNDSESIDDNASLPRTGESFENAYSNTSKYSQRDIGLEQALAIFGVSKDQNSKSILGLIDNYIEGIQNQLRDSSLLAVKQAYADELDKLKFAKNVIQQWLADRIEEDSIMTEDKLFNHQTQPVSNSNHASTTAVEIAKSKSSLTTLVLLLVIVLAVGVYFLFLRKENTEISSQLGNSIHSTLQDSVAWKTALAANNEAAYTHYLKEFPSGVFKTEAEENISKLKVKTTDVKPESGEVKNKDKQINVKTEKKSEAVQAVVEERNVDDIGRLAKRIRFKYDSSLVEPMSVLDKIATLMLGNPDKRYQLMVYSDEGNSSDYEDKIATQRGKSIKQYLMNRGVEAEAISIYSFGNTRSTCKESTTSCYNKNNRVEIEEF